MIDRLRTADRNERRHADRTGKQDLKINKAKVTPQKGLPHAKSHKYVEPAIRGGYHRKFAHYGRKYATYLQCEIRAVLARSHDGGTRLGGRVIVWTRVGVTSLVARAVKGRRSSPVGGGSWSVATVAGRRHARGCVWPAASAG